MRGHRQFSMVSFCMEIFRGLIFYGDLSYNKKWKAESGKWKAESGKWRIMFYIERQLLHNKDTIIPNNFFELVLPMLASAPYAVSVYLYGYYKSINQDEYADEIKTNEALAQQLGLSVDEVYASWKICEELGLIEKIVIDNELTGNYAIRFRDLRTIGAAKKSADANADEVLVAYQREEYKQMYDQIEQAVKYPLSSQDIKKIHHTINDYNINKSLAIEAVLYTIYKKNNRSIPVAMGVLRNWHLDGIRTVEDLEQMLQGKEKRYLEYKKILGAMGEYRGPTEPEKTMMDMWLDEYLFDIDAIIDAISRTTAIKSPNLNYVDGILKNRLKQVEALQKETADAVDMAVQKEIETDFEKRQRILELIEFTRKSLRKDEMADLDTLSRDFDFSDVEVAYRFLKRNNKDCSIASILRLLNGEDVQAERKNRITLAQVKIAEEQNRRIRQSYVRKGTVAAKNGENNEKADKPNPMEERFNKRRMEKANKDE